MLSFFPSGGMTSFLMSFVLDFLFSAPCFFLLDCFPRSLFLRSLLSSMGLPAGPSFCGPDLSIHFPAGLMCGSPESLVDFFFSLSPINTPFPRVVDLLFETIVFLDAAQIPHPCGILKAGAPSPAPTVSFQR